MQLPPVLAIACLVGVLCGQTRTPDPAPAPGPAPNGAPNAAAPAIAWESDYDAALQRAQKENRPLFVAFLMDNEPANDETVQKIYTDAEFVKLSSRCVCLVCCVGEHHPADHPADHGADGHPADGGNCARFPTVTCAQHQAIEKKARARWLVGEDVCAPQHLFCDPKGNVIVRKVFFAAKQELKKCFALALDAVTKDPESKSIIAAEAGRVDKWLRDAASRNAEVRDAALGELAVADDARALPAVIKLAKPGNDDPTRMAAIAALAKKGNFTAVKPLTPMLGDAKAQIAIRVALTLETIQIPDATPDLLAAVKKEHRDRVRGFLLRAAARCSPSQAAVRDCCLQSLKGASAQLEPCVLIALGRMQANSKIIEAMRPLLLERNQNTRGLAVWVLGCQGTADCAAAIQTLLQTEKTPEVTGTANSALKHCKGEKVDGWDNLFSTYFSDSDY
jgi:HEAT repeat protein